MLTFLIALLFAARLGIAVDEGSGLDPHGGIRATAQCTDEGNGFDPHGAPCIQRLGVDEGPGLDPNG